MKRLISAALVLTLLGTTVASAQPYRGHHGGGYGRSYGGHGGHRGNDGAALIGLGFGLFALGALAASSQRDRYDDRYYGSYEYGPPPPPPGYAQRYGYGY